MATAASHRKVRAARKASCGLGSGATAFREMGMGTRHVRGDGNAAVRARGRVKGTVIEASPTVHEHGRLFDGLPEEGIWTALALTRLQFFSILVLSMLLFVFVDGPVWLH